MMTEVIPETLYRASRPGRHSSTPYNVTETSVEAWEQDARDVGIRTIICLLSPTQLEYYQSILHTETSQDGKVNGIDKADDSSVHDESSGKDGPSSFIPPQQRSSSSVLSKSSSYSLLEHYRVAGFNVVHVPAEDYCQPPLSHDQLLTIYEVG